MIENNDDVSMMCLSPRQHKMISAASPPQYTGVLTLYPQEMHLITKTNGRHEGP